MILPSFQIPIIQRTHIINLLTDFFYGYNLILGETNGDNLQ